MSDSKIGQHLREASCQIRERRRFRFDGDDGVLEPLLRLHREKACEVAMYKTPESAFARIRTLSFPPIFVQIWENRGPTPLKGHYERPIRFFDELSSFGNAMRECIPLLEWNREAVLAFDEEQSQFIEYYYGDENPNVIGSTYQQFAAWILVDLGYAGLDDVVRDAAVQLQFEHSSELLRFLASDDDQSAEAAKRNFVASI